MTTKEAKIITGGLSNPEKMPCKAYNISPTACKTGSKLQNNPKSVCYRCYAKKGRYVFSNVRKSLEKRLSSINNDKWLQAMAHLINKSGEDKFRWHDAGDLQGKGHLLKIFKICELTPRVKHWLPTMELKIVREVIKNKKIPKNLIIRISSFKINELRKVKDLNTSFVYDNKENLDKKNIHICPATSTEIKTCVGNSCEACWDKKIKTIAYKKH